MTHIQLATHRRLNAWFGCGSLAHVGHIAIATALVVATGFTAAHASAIFGTLSNFDTYNTTPEPAEGAEIELEGIHASSIGGGYPSHYGTKTIAEYNDDMGNFAGTRITFKGYNFNPSGSLDPNPNPVSTNGHTCVNTEGCEHFGF